MTDIAKECVPEYQIKRNSKKGNWLAKNIELLSDHGLAPSLDSDDVALFHAYIEIRNCVVHSGGRSCGSGQLKEALDGIEKYAQGGNYIMIKIMDGHLVLGDDLISDVVTKSEDIIEGVLEKVAGC
jgi:hypothetical protein